MKLLNKVAIRGYEGLYEIDENGVVYSIITNSKIKPFVNNSGYLRVCLHDGNGNARKFYIHRLVAEHFVINESGGRYVDHKDCNKMNNHANNLEWVTQKENIRRSVVNGLQHTYVCVVDGVKYFSMREASEKVFNKGVLI